MERLGTIVRAATSIIGAATTWLIDRASGVAQDRRQTDKGDTAGRCQGVGSIP